MNPSITRHIVGLAPGNSDVFQHVLIHIAQGGAFHSIIMPVEKNMNDGKDRRLGALKMVSVSETWVTAFRRELLSAKKPEPRACDCIVSIQFMIILLFSPLIGMIVTIYL